MLTRNIIDAVAANKPVREKFGSVGRVHIDRQLPFVVVYRRPCGEKKIGTDRLLLGTPSYLIIGDDTKALSDTHRLLVGLVRHLQEAFGRVCLLELWESAAENSMRAAPAFEIVAPLHNTPTKFLEEFENALLHIEVEELPTSIQVRYQDRIAPPNMEPLISSDEADSLNCVSVGLAIRPIYRDHTTGELWPFHLEELHQRLNRALKRGFFAFMHHHTTERPRHFHELGQRTVAEVVGEVDRRLAAISDSFDLLLYVSPVNSASAWQEFEQHGFEHDVEFLYRARDVNPSLLKRQLFDIAIEDIEDPTLAHIFAEKRNELERQLSLIADRNTRRFLLESRQIFGDVEPELMDEAQALLDTAQPESANQMDTLNAREIAERAQSELNRYRQQDPSLAATVSIRNDVPGILVSRGNLLIGEDAFVSGTRIDALINHEVGTHIVTHHNGKQQPFKELHVGMAGYEAFQEGLAILSEYLSDGLPVGRLRLLAGRVIAVSAITAGANFIDCFRQLYRNHGFAANTAFNITMRVYRGGGYTKDVVYLRGLRQLLSRLGEGHPLDAMYLGKISHPYLEFVEELQWRQVINPPKIRPFFLDTAATRLKQENLASGITIAQLASE